MASQPLKTQTLQDSCAMHALAPRHHLRPCITGRHGMQCHISIGLWCNLHCCHYHWSGETCFETHTETPHDTPALLHAARGFACRMCGISKSETTDSESWRLLLAPRTMKQLGGRWHGEQAKDARRPKKGNVSMQRLPMGLGKTRIQGSWYRCNGRAHPSWPMATTPSID